MRATTTHRRRRRANRAAGLSAIAEIVDAAFSEDPIGNGLLVRVVDAPDGNADELELGLKPLEGAHPFPLLAGFTAPPEWWAVGVVVTGRARHLDEPDRAPHPMVTTHLVDRTGRSVSLLRDGNDVTRVPGPAIGLLPETLQRVLGLPTAPPGGTTRALFAVAWLDRIVAACAEDGGINRWATVAALHPAAAGGTLPWRALVEQAHQHAERFPWARVRCEPTVLDLPGDQLDDDSRAWMDDGMFARWAMGAYPAPADLAGALLDLVPSALADRIVSTLVASLDEPGS